MSRNRSRPSRRLLRWVFAGGVLLVIASPAPASATVTGGCQGAGTINGTRHDAAALDPDDPIRIPTEADVAYEGSVPLPAGDAERAHSGQVKLKLPLGGSVTVADWSGVSKEVVDAGVYHYDIPAIVPRGVTVKATGTHNHEGLSAPCTGAFAIELEGGPLDSPVPTAVAAAGTILSGAALARAAFPKGVKE